MRNHNQRNGGGFNPLDEAFQVGLEISRQLEERVIKQDDSSFGRPGSPHTTSIEITDSGEVFQNGDSLGFISWDINTWEYHHLFIDVVNTVIRRRVVISADWVARANRAYEHLDPQAIKDFVWRASLKQGVEDEGLKEEMTQDLQDAALLALTFGIQSELQYDGVGYIVKSTRA